MDVFRPLTKLHTCESESYDSKVSEKEWTKYRGVFFTFIAVLQGFHLFLELFAVAQGPVFDAGTVVVDSVDRVVQELGNL